MKVEAKDSSLNITVIGHGKMAYDCVSRLCKRTETSSLVLVSNIGDDPSSTRLAGLCKKNSIELISAIDPNAEDVINRLSECPPDVIFNIDSFSILRQSILSIPSAGVINFHNGPLPKYAGMNIPTWAIWNGETIHGVTWHFVTETVDGGNILCQTSFPIKGDETAASLMFKCIVEGTRLFDQAFNLIVAGEHTGSPQSGTRTYFSRTSIPNDGYIDPGWNAETMQRFLRAFDYRPFPAAGPCPRIRTPSGYCRFSKARIDPSQDSTGAETGAVLQVDDEAIRIQTASGILMIETAVDEAGRPIPLNRAAQQQDLAPGKRLPALS